LPVSLGLMTVKNLFG